MANNRRTRNYTTMLSPLSDVRFDRYYTAEQGTDAWHELRKNCIGSSSAAAVFPNGISTTTKPCDLRRKLCFGGTGKKFTDYSMRFIEAGNTMEPVLRRELQALLGLPIYEVGIFVDRQCEKTLGVALCSSCDGMVQARDGSVAITEYKWRTTGDPSWNGELGKTVFTQVQQQMFVTGIHKTYVYVGAQTRQKAQLRRLWSVTYDGAFIQYWKSYVRHYLNNDCRYRAKFNEKDTVRVFIAERIGVAATELLVPDVFGDRMEAKGGVESLDTEHRVVGIE